MPVVGINLIIESKLIGGEQTITFNGIGFNKQGQVFYDGEHFQIIKGSSVLIRTKHFRTMKTRLIEICKNENLFLTITNH